MSLQTAAEAVRQKGRGEDTMLIHMTPGEVKGLQQLAMAYGGSLSINPETGLPEASFLKSLLPTLIGFALGPAGVGLTAMQAGLVSGGLRLLTGGTLSEGLMAGLGAYGGAGLGGALTNAGQNAGTMAASEAGRNAALQSTAAQTPNVLATQAPSLATTPLQTAMQAGSSAVPTAAFSPMTAQAAPSALQGAMQAGSSSAATGLATPIGAATYSAPTTFAGNLAQAGRGLGNIVGVTGTEATQEAARTAAMGSLGGTSGAIRTGAAALAGPLSQPIPMYTPEEEEYNYDGPYVPTERQVRFPTADRDPMDSSEFQYFDVVNPAPGFQTMASATPTTNLSGEPTFAGIPVSLATNPDRMREYQANPNLYSFAEGGTAKGPSTPPINTPPADYRAGMQAEFDYGFRPMASQIPEIQQEAAVYNPVARERYGFTPGDGGENRGASQVSMDMGYVPGFVAGLGRTFNNMAGLEKALIPGAVVGQAVTDNIMSQRGYAYNPLTRDYEQRDYMGGGSKGYSTLSGRDSYSGGDDGGYNPNDSYGDSPNVGDSTDTFFRAGGGLNMDNGGFVVDAHTVSEIGNGSSDAGHEMLARIGGEPIKGPGDGVSDSIRANIGGVQEARVAKDESYLSREDVKALGGGNLKKGEKMLYKLMAEAHKSRKQKGRGQATGLDKLIARMA